MTYDFRCPKCSKTYEREIAMESYDLLKYSQVCPQCGGFLTRVIEWTGAADINGGYESVGGRAEWQQ